MQANRKSFSTFVFFISAIFIGSVAWALEPTVKTPQVDTPQRVLLVGNSYLYYGDSLHNILRRMVAADNAAISKSLQYKSVTIGGASLDHHNMD